MPFRYYDWECQSCSLRHSPLVWVEHGEDVPDRKRIGCPRCDRSTRHDRCVSRPALYTYDRPYAPAVKGGSFDTMGYRKPPPIPELPNDASMTQAREFINSKEFRERKKERWDIVQQNAAKRARAKAMQKHPTMDIRNTPLPGDPPRESVVAKRAKKIKTA